MSLLLYNVLLDSMRLLKSLRHKQRIHFVGLLAIFAAVTACTPMSLREIFNESTIVSADFAHRVIENKSDSSSIHVYIEGDGRPWRTRTAISTDPSSRNPLMARLMSIDGAHSIYLGRPCYFKTKDPLCNPLWWTNARYSKRVVDSMNSALNQLVDNSKPIVLIGHSGGGTIAMLMAESRHDTVAVITLAGNLNVAAWAAHHDYSPLAGSLDPFNSKPLRKEIKQVHYLGTEDRTILKSMVTPVIQRQHNAQFVELQQVNHSCCWDRIWVDLLESIPYR